MTGRHGDRRHESWLDDVKGGVSEIVLEALVVAALMVFAFVVAFVVVTVV